MTSSARPSRSTTWPGRTWRSARTIAAAEDFRAGLEESVRASATSKASRTGSKGWSRSRRCSATSNGRGGCSGRAQALRSRAVSTIRPREVAVPAVRRRARWRASTPRSSSGPRDRRPGASRLERGRRVRARNRVEAGDGALTREPDGARGRDGPHPALHEVGGADHHPVPRGRVGAALPAARRHGAAVRLDDRCRR